jgi:hypothetical protein
MDLELEPAGTERTLDVVGDLFALRLGNFAWIFALPTAD